MRLKVHNPTGETGLCGKCSNGITARFSNGSFTIHCTLFSPSKRILSEVVQCSDYEDRTRDDEFKMRQIAWTVSTDPEGRVIGFKPPTHK